MMDFTARMATLLGAMRRERNGAVADEMFSYGRRCGLNYGVSIPTVRQIARAEAPDHDFARYLWQQDVRELRLAALHLAQPERFVTEEFEFWAAGVRNSELAEEAAFALLSRAESLPELFAAWIGTEDPLLQYAALMASSRADAPIEWIAPAVETMHRAGASPTPYAERLIVRALLALLASIGARSDADRRTVLCVADSLGDSPSADLIREELGWRI